eukprot:TRINITY_DN38189_c0_g1_i1.p2 TRINITY_DN38189_c0_g1~~TRINITY_DN38189_c0_g1_i1.p2  ORF type:complete len:231 (+),score=81.84 TRINITY_DN38189_c0_g1_i1:43-693(+)
MRSARGAARRMAGYAAEGGLWAAKLFEKRQRNPPQQRVVFFGDSDVEYWDLAAGFSGGLFGVAGPPTNVGVAGAEMVHCAAYAPRLLEKYSPKVVVLAAGENDIANGRSPADTAASCIACVRALLASCPRVICVSAKRTPAAEAAWGQHREYNALVAEGLQGAEGVFLMDCVDAFAQGGDPEAPPDRALFRGDGLHLSRRGYAVWEQMLRKLAAAG